MCSSKSEYENVYIFREQVFLQGRPSVDEISKMLQHIDEHNKAVGEDSRIRTSVELEQPTASLGKHIIPDSLIAFVTITASPRNLLACRYETVVSKNAVRQVHFCVIKFNRADYIVLNLPFSADLVSYVITWVT